MVVKQSRRAVSFSEDERKPDSHEGYGKIKRKKIFHIEVPDFTQ